MKPHLKVFVANQSVFCISKGKDDEESKMYHFRRAFIVRVLNVSVKCYVIS